MIAADRERIRQARNQQARQEHPWVPDTQLASTYGICLRCSRAFEPVTANRQQIYCGERCRKQASLQRTRKSRARA